MRVFHGHHTRTTASGRTTRGGWLFFYAPTPLARLRHVDHGEHFLATNEPRPAKTEAHFVIRAGLSRHSRAARRAPRVLAETRRLC